MPNYELNPMRLATICLLTVVSQPDGARTATALPARLPKTISPLRLSMAIRDLLGAESLAEAAN